MFPHLQFTPIIIELPKFGDVVPEVGPFSLNLKKIETRKSRKLRQAYPILGHEKGHVHMEVLNITGLDEGNPQSGANCKSRMSLDHG